MCTYTSGSISIVFFTGKLISKLFQMQLPKIATWLLSACPFASDRGVLPHWKRITLAFGKAKQKNAPETVRDLVDQIPTYFQRCFLSLPRYPEWMAAGVA